MHNERSGYCRRKIKQVNLVQILDDAISISFGGQALRKDMIPSWS